MYNCELSEVVDTTLARESPAQLVIHSVLH